MDSRLRTLERRAATGDREAELQLLVMRVRSGEISSENLRLAAYLEDPLAQQALADCNIHASKHKRRWARGIARFGEEPSIRATMVCYKSVIDGLDDIPRPTGWARDRLRRLGVDRLPIAEEFLALYRAAQRWFEDRSAEAASEVARLENSYVETRDNLQFFERYNSCWPESYLTEMVRGRAARSLDRVFSTAVTTLAPARSKWGKQQATDALRTVVTRDLLDWALSGLSNVG
jgi:hypothetical protein